MQRRNQSNSIHIFNQILDEKRSLSALQKRIALIGSTRRKIKLKVKISELKVDQSIEFANGDVDYAHILQRKIIKPYHANFLDLCKIGKRKDDRVVRKKSISPISKKNHSLDEIPSSYSTKNISQKRIYSPLTIKAPTELIPPFLINNNSVRERIYSKRFKITQNRPRSQSPQSEIIKSIFEDGQFKYLNK